MTPLKPIENTTRVRGVPSKRYPINTICAHPDCTRTDVTAHHIFGRPRGPDSDSWFVEVLLPSPDELPVGTVQIIPHVSGLCGHGTEGHHGEAESHAGWIKYEDGEFVWYERQDEVTEIEGKDTKFNEWVRVGPLNPQPGSREGKPKRRRFKGEQRRQRKTLAIKVPQDEQENGGQVWDELIENVRFKLAHEGLDSNRPVYYILVDALNDWLTS